MYKHEKFDTILKVLQSNKRVNKNIMLVGPAGSSKTTTVKQVAENLNLDFYPMSVGIQTTKSDLIGFINAKGDYITTPIREAFEKGGVLLLDEFDACHAGVVTILNSLLANDICSFPDKTIKKHKDFICICACNTYGKGADLTYIGRNRLDSATLDRFIAIDMDYDEDLENKLTQNTDWIKVIRKIRDNAKKNGLKIVVSPRASMQGADLLEAEFNIDDVLNMVIFKGASSDVKQQLLKDVDLSAFYSKKKNKNKINKNIPIKVYINFDLNSYSLEDIENDTSIIEGSDYEGKFSMFFSVTNGYSSKLTSNSLFLNRGKTNAFSVESKSVAKKFISNLETYNNSIDLEYQPIFFTIILDNEEYKIEVK